VLIFYPTAKPHPADILKMRMDVGLEYPVEPTRLVQVLAQLGGLDAHQLLDKMIKGMAQDSMNSGPSFGGRNNDDSKDSSVLVSGGKFQPQDSASLRGGKRSHEEPEAVSGEEFDLLDDSIPLTKEIEEGDDSVPAKGGESEDPLFPLTPSLPEESSKPLEGVSATDPILQELEDLLKKTEAAAQPEPPPALNDPLRAERYSKVLEITPPLNLAAIRRREAKNRLKDVVKDISKETLRNQDDLRREFVKALFKKKG
jgi:hypothetical protein